MFSNLNIKGKIKISQYVKGKLVNEFEFDNLITNNGFNYLQKLFAGQVGPINKLALGDDNTEPNVNDVALKNRLIMVDISGRELSFAKEIQFLCSIPEGSFTKTVNFKEGGLIYKAGSEEILITRLAFPQIVYQTTDSSLSIAYSLILSQE